MFVTKSQLLVLVSKNVSQTADLIIIIYLQFWTLKEGIFNYMRGQSIWVAAPLMGKLIYLQFTVVNFIFMFKCLFLFTLWFVMIISNRQRFAVSFYFSFGCCQCLSVFYYLGCIVPDFTSVSCETGLCLRCSSSFCQVPHRAGSKGSGRYVVNCN